MKKVIFLLFFSFCFVALYAQFKYGSFVLKGQVKNFKEPFFDVMMTTYFGAIQKTVKVQPDGRFEQEFIIQNKQKFYPHLNNTTVLFTVQDKDTITMEWDDADTLNGVMLKGGNSLRTAELQLQVKLVATYLPLYQSLVEKMSTEKLDEEVQYKLINDLYNKHVKAIFDSYSIWSENLNQLVTSIYFQYTAFLQEQKLLPKYKLVLVLDKNKTYPQFDLAPNPYYYNTDYTTLTEQWCWEIPEYRLFLESYLQFYKPFKSYSSNMQGMAKPFNPTLDAYYSAFSNFNFISVRDWYITNAIITGFEHYDFADVEKVYKMAAATIRSQYLKDTLLKYYTAMKRLRPGSVAPGFVLKNNMGQSVALNDFKGKVVYIDFWGVTCGPCIAEIEKGNPALHKQYEKKNVVFLNICVDSKPNEWKEALAKYNLNSVNLIAEGWTLNPVCKAYNVTAIPHYVLIDKNGKIANNNAPTATMLDLSSGKNAIDMLLK